MEETIEELKSEIEALKNNLVKPTEKPFNFFASAGLNYRIGTNYNVIISPIDQVVKFEEVSALSSGLSTGLVWNPFTYKKKKFTYEGKKKDWEYVVKRHPLSFALLLNILKISYSDEQSKTVSPIDVGLGVGYRKGNLLALFTVELSPVRQPRTYFINAYKGRNKQLMLNNTTDPVDSLSHEDPALFTTKLFVHIGIKIAYSFIQK